MWAVSWRRTMCCHLVRAMLQELFNPMRQWKLNKCASTFSALWSLPSSNWKVRQLLLWRTRWMSSGRPTGDTGGLRSLKWTTARRGITDTDRSLKHFGWSRYQDSVNLWQFKWIHVITNNKCTIWQLWKEKLIISGFRPETELGLKFWSKLSASTSLMSYGDARQT